MAVFTGTAGVDTLTGTAGNDTLDGGAGADTMIGGGGSDTFFVDNPNDVIMQTGTGPDTVISSVSFSAATLPDVANVTLTGTANVNAFGNTGVNILTGNSGDNLLNGHGGADTMMGGAGNDTYFVDSTGDVVVENLNEGNDTVVSTKSFILGDNVENLTLSGTLNVNGTGNTEDNILIGNGSDNTLIGNGGNDTFQGGQGNDTLEGSAGNDTFLFAQGDGHDVVMTGGGTDKIVFDASVAPGNATYVQSGNDLVIDYGTDGDSVTVQGYFSGAASQISSVNFSDGTVQDSAFISANLTTITDQTLIGTPGMDTLIGGAGNDTIDGGLGNDTLSGGAGNDTFLFAQGDGQDVITDFNNSDMVKFDASVSPDSVTYTKSGNDLIIHYGTGTDSITVDNYFTTQNETIVFSDGTVQDATFIDAHLTTTQDMTLIGTAGVDTLVGGGGNDTLQGGAGNDVLTGGAGNNTFLFAQGDGQDVVTDAGGSNVFKFDASVSPSSVTYSESGNDLVIHYGTAGDTVTVDNFFSNTANQNDSVSFSDGTVENAAFIEAHLSNGAGTAGNDILVGQPNGVLVGGAGDDLLVGLSGNNTFIGGTGNDTMVAGGGNDTYLFSQGDGKDLIVETGGTDNIQFDASVTPASVTYIQSGNDLIIDYGTHGDSITVSGYFNGTAGQVESVSYSDGTVQDASFITSHLSTGLVLTGTDGVDTLTGLGGNDTITGGANNDTLVGGTGNDTYLFSQGDGQDVVINSGGTDTIKFDASVSPGTVFYTQSGNDLIVHYGVQGDTVDVQNFFTNGASQTEQVMFNDGSVQDASFINSHLTAVTTQAERVLGTNGDDNLIGGLGNDRMLGFNGDDTLTGLDGRDLMAGMNGNDTLFGGAGNDILSGGNGNDTLDGGAGHDTLFGGQGNDTFLFDSSVTPADTDIIADFRPGQDTIDIHSVLTGFDPLTSNLSDFVQLTRVGHNTVLSVDTDGAANGHNFVELAVIHGLIGTDAATLVANHELVVA